MTERNSLWWCLGSWAFVGSVALSLLYLLTWYAIKQHVTYKTACMCALMFCSVAEINLELAVMMWWKNVKVSCQEKLGVIVLAIAYKIALCVWFHFKYYWMGWLFLVLKVGSLHIEDISLSEPDHINRQGTSDLRNSQSSEILPSPGNGQGG